MLAILRFFDKFLPVRAFSFHRHQEATIIRIYFFVNDFCVHDTAEPQTIMVCLIVLH